MKTSASMPDFKALMELEPDAGLPDLQAGLPENPHQVTESPALEIEGTTDMMCPSAPPEGGASLPRTPTCKQDEFKKVEEQALGKLRKEEQEPKVLESLGDAKTAWEQVEDRMVETPPLEEAAEASCQPSRLTLEIPKRTIAVAESRHRGQTVLAVELLLLDEDGDSSGSEGAGGRRGSSGKSLLQDLQRQLQDAGSHLRRKSAFGALIARGAQIRLLGYEQFGDEQGKAATLDRGETLTERSPTWSRPGVVPQRMAERAERGYARQNIAQAVGVVPRISDFPRPNRGPLDLPIDGGLGIISTLFSWLPNCSPTAACKASPSETIDSACSAIGLSEQIAKPGSVLRSHRSEVEAGLGGWPLSLPQAYVAFLTPQTDSFEAIEASEEKKAMSHAGSALTEAAKAARKAPVFQKAAVELDENELVLVLAASQMAGRASTATSKMKSEPDLTLQPWPAQSRLVCPREGLSRVKTWRPVDVARLSCLDGPLPWPHVVEFDGQAFGVQDPLRVLLALPTSALITRFREAVSQATREKANPRAAEDRSRSEGQGQRARGALRCKLCINARVRLSCYEDEENCAAVVRRGIFEACHVSADRVQIQKIWAEPSESPVTWAVPETESGFGS